MLDNPYFLNGLLDELQAIEKEAAWATLFRPLGSALGKAFTGFGRGATNIGRAATGTVTGRAGQQLALAGPKRWALARAGAKQMMPGAAVAGLGGLGLYGAGHAAFGS